MAFSSSRIALMKTLNLSKSTISGLSSTKMITNPVKPMCTKAYFVDELNIQFITAKNPHVVEGCPYPLYWHEDDEALYVRVDMPGAKKEGLKVWLDSNAIYFEAEVPMNDPKFDKEIPRKFEGIVPLHPSNYRIEEAKSVISYGVLQVLVQVAK